MSADTSTTMAQPLPLIQTTCKDCIFATFEYLRADESLTQTGCRLGRLDKFQKNGISTYIQDTSDGKGAYVIEGRICMAARKGEWGKTLSPAEQEAKVREELRFACHVYIVAHHSTPEEIEKTLESLVVQQPQPTVAEALIFGRARPGPLLMRLKDKYDGRINWKLTIKNTDETTTLEAIDSAVAACRSPFYSVFLAGSEAKEDFLSRLDRLVNDELTTFAVALGDDDGNGTVIVTQMHQALGGNEPVDMVEGDPDAMAEEDEIDALTTTVTGIVNKVRFLAEKCGVKGLILEDKPCQK